ncbi:MAG: hypothetical protein LC130_10590 [Bryobacterales bacterium]|nr:hypothetical protein [Bryobacterales bacterium]MEB2364086.1 hypothetical protein [Bryobacterales bacterium]
MSDRAAMNESRENSMIDEMRFQSSLLHLAENAGGADDGSAWAAEAQQVSQLVSRIGTERTCLGTADFI